MSLATRCTACGTVFRVVQDQLKVSEGWVRCGRCNEVFNALEGLFDLERDTPPQGPAANPSEPAATAATAAAAPEVGAPALFDAAGQTPPDDEGHSRIDKIDAQLMGSRESDLDSTPATRISERDRLEFPDAQFDPEIRAEDHAPALPAVAQAPWAVDSAAALEEPRAAPAFVERARRQERWQRPRMRMLWACTAVALLAVLALQGVHHFRDLTAARWPDTRPALTAWCAALSCTLDAPRRIEDLAVESTALARAPLPDAFRLSVVLRNRGATVVALPSLDLTLTDANGQLVARRVLAPRDFRAASAPIKPGAESAMQLSFAAGSAGVTGYTVEVFYP